MQMFFAKKMHVLDTEPEQLTALFFNHLQTLLKKFSAHFRHGSKGVSNWQKICLPLWRMKRIVHILSLTLVLGLASLGLHAQSGTRGDMLRYQIDANGDTLFVDYLPAARVWPKRADMSAKEWRQYYKLVYNFNKVYPYAILGGQLITQVEAEIESRPMNRIQKERYIAGVQKQMVKDFEKSIRGMSFSQGKLLVRLIDREIGKTSYDIIKDYRSSIAAGFWQGVAKLFDNNLKSRYDPFGEDKNTEQLVTYWEEGSFDDLYYSIFLEWPEHKDLPSKYR